MIKIERELGSSLYEEVRKIVLKYQNDENCYYKKEQHHLYENVGWEVEKKFYNENGKVQFMNMDGNLVEVEIYRWHNHQHNGYSGLCGAPCLEATIYLTKEERQKVWELKICCGTLHYDGSVSALELPMDILRKKEESLEETLEEKDTTVLVGKEALKERESLFTLVSKQQEKIRFFLEKKEAILKNRDRELEEAKKKIISSYSIELSETEKETNLLRQELDEFSSLLHQYSTFDSVVISDIISQLISIYEEEKYSSTTLQYPSKRRVHGVMDSWEEDVDTRIRVIGSDLILSNYLHSKPLSDEVVCELISTGKVFLLSKESGYLQDNRNITFYHFTDGKFYCQVDFGEFGYVKDFIEQLVQYRLEANLENITIEEITFALKNYLHQHQENVIVLHGEKIKQKISNL